MATTKKYMQIKSNSKLVERKLHEKNLYIQGNSKKREKAAQII